MSPTGKSFRFVRRARRSHIGLSGMAVGNIRYKDLYSTHKLCKIMLCCVVLRCVASTPTLPHHICSHEGCPYGCLLRGRLCPLQVKLHRIHLDVVHAYAQALHIFFTS